MAKPSPRHAKHPSLKAVGQTILGLRTKACLSQEALALAAGMDRSYVGGIERGEHNLTLINLSRLADALHTSTSELLKKSGM